MSDRAKRTVYGLLTRQWIEEAIVVNAKLREGYVDRLTADGTDALSLIMSAAGWKKKARRGKGVETGLRSDGGN